jgi:hypothetical protein
MSQLRRELEGLDVPAGRLGEGDREHGPVAVDDVETEDQWDAQPAVLDRELLCPPGGLGAGDIEHAADKTTADPLESFLSVLVVWRRSRDVEVAGVEVELADLLLQRHLFEELVDVALDVGGFRA